MASTGASREVGLWEGEEGKGGKVGGCAGWRQGFGAGWGGVAR